MKIGNRVNLTVDEIKGRLAEIERRARPSKAEQRTGRQGPYSFDYKVVYEQQHTNPKRFMGNSLRKYVPEIAELVAEFQPRKLLDYGCGKGYQYLRQRVHEAWGGLLPYCYDVGVRALRSMPPGPFDGIICTDVMEHIAEVDVPLIFEHLFAQLSDDGRPTFVFFGIDCAPAVKEFTKGEGMDLHLTVQPPEWWESQMARYRHRCKIVARFSGLEA